MFQFNPKILTSTLAKRASAAKNESWKYAKYITVKQSGVTCLASWSHAVSLWIFWSHTARLREGAWCGFMRPMWLHEANHVTPDGKVHFFDFDCILTFLSFKNKCFLFRYFPPPPNEWEPNVLYLWSRWASFILRDQQ